MVNINIGLHQQRQQSVDSFPVMMCDTDTLVNQFLPPTPQDEESPNRKRLRRRYTRQRTMPVTIEEIKEVDEEAEPPVSDARRASFEDISPHARPGQALLNQVAAELRASPKHQLRLATVGRTAALQRQSHSHDGVVSRSGMSLLASIPEVPTTPVASPCQMPTAPTPILSTPSIDDVKKKKMDLFDHEFDWVPETVVQTYTT
jgi:hypothetical protein